METPKVLKPSDPCPTCGGTLAVVASAPIKDNSQLARCGACGYQTRFPVKAKAKAADADA